jgi:hypothetical protein
VGGGGPFIQSLFVRYLTLSCSGRCILKRLLSGVGLFLLLYFVYFQFAGRYFTTLYTRTYLMQALSFSLIMK